MATETSATERPADRDPGRHDPSETESPDPVLSEIGVALFHLRRVWAKPDLMKRIRAQTSSGPGGRPLQISNLMVVNAVAALTDAALCAPGQKPARDDDTGEVTVGAVAERLEVDPSTASRLVGHAIDAGLVSRRPSPVDARRANLGLTDAGRRVKQVADRFRRAYLDELMTGWSPTERTEFARLLTRFADAAAQAPMYPDGIDRIFEEAAFHDPAQQSSP
ncbi:MarR family winged helix-turn-helix transcriptional regulator [Actinomadura rubrisoli]|uniref:MarR family transcriptional regulator n=1 Tax=Actinomadura rubrisoli TaxID=2530368 RepID=A0A4R5AC03_9ACTN|nr:MarR family winged helix-turn-helix transcriptional regulator [Actinomadura rubrisoli]TDD69741.1 MarR family transcriptional regulator [Actinomadura rubrisoli]